MSKLKTILHDCLSAGREQVTGVIIAYNANRHIAERIAGILPYPVKFLDIDSISQTETVNIEKNISHVIELYRPRLETYAFGKELRQSFWREGCKILSLFDWEEDYLHDKFWGDIDYLAQDAEVAELAAKLQNVKSCRVTSELGTDISFSVEGRSWRDASGLCLPGRIAQLPDGEIYTCPVEETFSGTLVIDGTVSRSWIPENPLKLDFHQGKLVDCPKEFSEYIKDYPEAIRTIGEFAIGVNHSISGMVGNISVDEKAAGTVHFALGNSYGIGINNCDCHIDMVITKPVLHFDPPLAGF